MSRNGLSERILRNTYLYRHKMTPFTIRSHKMFQRGWNARIGFHKPFTQKISRPKKQLDTFLDFRNTFWKRDIQKTITASLLRKQNLSAILFRIMSQMNTTWIVSLLERNLSGHGTTRLTIHFVFISSRERNRNGCSRFAFIIANIRSLVKLQIDCMKKSFCLRTFLKKGNPEFHKCFCIRREGWWNRLSDITQNYFSQTDQNRRSQNSIGCDLFLRLCFNHRNPFVSLNESETERQSPWYEVKTGTASHTFLWTDCEKCCFMTWRMGVTQYLFRQAFSAHQNRLPFPLSFSEQNAAVSALLNSWQNQTGVLQ